MSSRKSWIAALTAVLLAAVIVLAGALAPTAGVASDRCAGGGSPRPAGDGIGGTGARPASPGDDADGIGGTGRGGGGDDDDSGIGGTGISATDTGVIGAITGFASICVGGVEIHYDAGSRVRVDGRASSAAALAVGQVVEVVASGGETELVAREIMVQHVVVGPVTRVDPARGEIEVVGQAVLLLPATRLADGSGEGPARAEDLAIGTVVEVSGLRRTDGLIAASRLSRRADAPAAVQGTVLRAPDGGLTVAGTPVTVSGVSAPMAGDEVRVVGRWDGQRLLVADVTVLPRVPFDGRVGRIAVEGYGSMSAEGRLRVGSFLFELSPAAAAALSTLAGTAPVRIEAVVGGRGAVVERIDLAPPLPPRPDARTGAGQDRGRRPAGEPVGAPRPPEAGSRSNPHGAEDARPAGLPEAAHPAPLSRPERLERPVVVPDRPVPVERPPVLDRPVVPDRPALTDRPSVPDRPPRPDRPTRP